MKLARTSLELFQTIMICAILGITPGLSAAEITTSNSSVQQLLDINTADASAIAETMDGIGMVKAQEIVTYREQFGKFRSIEQLLDVKGIGMATLEKNRDRITVVLD